MAITALNIKKQIEAGIITLLQADDYIVNNSLPVIPWFDTTTKVIGRQIVVHVDPETPSILDENGEAGEWGMRIDLFQYIHDTEDETPGSETETIYQILMGFVQQTTKAAIQATLTGLTVNGKNTNESAEDYNVEERFYQKFASMTIYVQ